MEPSSLRRLLLVKSFLVFLAVCGGFYFYPAWEVSKGLLIGIVPFVIAAIVLAVTFFIPPVSKWCSRQRKSPPRH
jgi:hypothetical protein